MPDRWHGRQLRNLRPESNAARLCCVACPRPSAPQRHSQEKHEFLRKLGVKRITSTRDGAKFEEDLPACKRATACIGVCSISVQGGRRHQVVGGAMLASAQSLSRERRKCAPAASPCCARVCLSCLVPLRASPQDIAHELAAGHEEVPQGGRHRRRRRGLEQLEPRRLHSAISGRVEEGSPLSHVSQRSGSANGMSTSRRR